MRHFIKTSIVAASLLIATPSLANASGFESTLTAPITSDIKIEVRLSEDLAARANDLPEKLSDRGSGSGIRSAFSQNGYYGDKDLAQLQKRMEKRLTQQFEKRGVNVSSAAPVVIRVTLTDVKNNRPTFRQMSKSTGLSFQSFGTGGAEFEAEVISAGGKPLGMMSYDWYEYDVRDAQFRGTWTDAHRAMDRFAKHAAKNLANG